MLMRGCGRILSEVVRESASDQYQRLLVVGYRHLLISRGREVLDLIVLALDSDSVWLGFR